jgi:hypothetical protein
LETILRDFMTIGTRAHPQPPSLVVAHDPRRRALETELEAATVLLVRRHAAVGEVAGSHANNRLKIVDLP